MEMKCLSGLDALRGMAAGLFVAAAATIIVTYARHAIATSRGIAWSR